MATRSCVICLLLQFHFLPFSLTHTYRATLAFLLSWEHSKYVPASGPLYMCCFFRLEYPFLLDSLTSCTRTPFRSLPNIIPPYVKKHCHHLVFFRVFIIICHCIIYYIIYWFIISHYHQNGSPMFTILFSALKAAFDLQLALDACFLIKNSNKKLFLFVRQPSTYFICTNYLNLPNGFMR